MITGAASKVNSTAATLNSVAEALSLIHISFIPFNSSKIGFMALLGPHHSAKKSTNTGMFERCV